MEGIIGDSTRVIATCGTLSLGLRSVNLFLLHSSYTASTLATGGYQIGSEKLIEILHVFVLETYELGCENCFLKLMSLMLYTLLQPVLMETEVSKRN